jgi:hypothetical protein
MKSRFFIAVVVCLCAGIGQVRAQENKNVAELKDIVLEGGTPDVVPPRTPLQWSVGLNNADAAQGSLKAAWSIEDWSGPIAHGDQAAGQDGPIRLGFTPERMGWHQLTVRLIDAKGTELSSRKRCFVVGQSLPPQERPFRYGVLAHLMRCTPAELTKQADLIGHLGADVVRTDATWDHIQPDREVWNYQKLDRCIDALISRKVEPQLTLAYTARWATTGDRNAADWHQWHNVAPQSEAYVRFAEMTVNRYKDRVHHWEIWNEPDINFWLSTPEAYAELFNAASRHIAEVDPTAKVLNGGFAMIEQGPNKNFLARALPLMDQADWSVWAYHDYHTFQEMQLREDKHRKYYKDAGARMPVWINEGGFLCLLPGGERAQALTLVKKIASAPSMGIAGYVWYDLRDDGQDPVENEHHMGLTSFNYQPKPAFAAYQNLIRELGGKPFAGRLKPQTGLEQTWGLVYGSPAPSEQVMVLWIENPDRRVPVWIGASGGAIESIDDFMGNRLPPRRLGEGTVVTLSDEPLYVRFRGDMPVVKPILDTPAQVAVLPDKPAEFEVRVSNPLATAITFQCDASTTLTGYVAAVPMKSLTVAPRSAGSLRVTLTPSAASPSQVQDTDYRGTASVRLASEDGVLEVQVACERVLSIPRRGEGNEALSLDLTDRNHLYNLFTAVPRPEMRWGGKPDLSAKARITCDKDALYLSVAVEDDKHSQPGDGSKLWEGDSLQVAMQIDESIPQMLELTIGLKNTGEPDGWVFSSIPDTLVAMGAIDAQQTAYSVERHGTQTTYTLRLPWDALKLTGPPKGAFRLNFLVNDDDGLGRKQWMEWTPGIGKEKNPTLFRRFVGK